MLLRVTKSLSLILFCWPGNHPFLAVVDTQIDHRKFSIHDGDFLCFVLNGELYVDGNGDSKCLGMKSD